MHSFPGEQERSAEAQQKLADLFSLAESLFNYWTDQEKDKWSEEVAVESGNLALILDVQACRLFRSVIEACRRAEGFNASILARTLFETILGVAFLLKKDVRIVVEPVVPKGTPPGTVPTKFAAKVRSKRAKRTRKHMLSRELRASLFLAYTFIMEEEGIASMGSFPGFYHKAKRLQKTIDPKVKAEHEKTIGPCWSYILRHSNTYAGLSVKDLAEVIDIALLRWYEAIYHEQSLAVHALDILKHVRIVDQNSLAASFLSPVNEVYLSLRSATALFFAHMHIVHENLGLGTAADIAFSSLKQKYDRISYPADESGNT
jgi:Family of unknown function (DUF5677)